MINNLIKYFDLLCMNFKLINMTENMDYYRIIFIYIIQISKTNVK